MNEYKIDEGEELYEVVDNLEKAPWYIRWNPLLRLLFIEFITKKYVDVMDEEGNVRRIYEKLNKGEKEK